MTNKKILLLQKIFTWFCLILAICLFVYSLYFATPFSDVMLYGNKEMLEAFANELQVFNRALYYVGIFVVCYGALLLLLQTGKYFQGKIMFPILTVLAVATIGAVSYSLFSIGTVQQLFDSFDYSTIEKLADFSISSAHYVGLIVVISMYVISVIGLIVAFTLGFIKVCKHTKGGKMNEQEC